MTPRRWVLVVLAGLVAPHAKADPPPLAPPPPAPCALAGEPTTLAPTKRAVSWVGAAPAGDGKAVVWWTDGGTSKLGLVDPAGALVGGETALDPGEGGVIMAASVTPTGDRFVVTYVHKHGPRWQHCDFEARPWAPPAAPGPATVLASDVCAQSGYPVVGFRGGVVFVAYTMGYEGTGLHVLAWTPGHAPADHVVAAASQLTEPLALAATGTGLRVAWRDDEGGFTHVQDLGPGGAPTGTATRVRLPDRTSTALLPDGPVRWQKTRTGIRVAPLQAGSGAPPWTSIDLGARLSGAALRPDATPLAVLGLASDRVPRWQLLDAHAAPEGGPILLPRLPPRGAGDPWPAPVRQGARGAVIWADRTARALRWQALRCR